jgi:hypothetical protein
MPLSAFHNLTEASAWLSDTMTTAGWYDETLIGPEGAPPPSDVFIAGLQEIQDGIVASSAAAMGGVLTE